MLETAVDTQENEEKIGDLTNHFKKNKNDKPLDKDEVSKMYKEYFESLGGLNRDGFYELNNKNDNIYYLHLSGSGKHNDYKSIVLYNKLALGNIESRAKLARKLVADAEDIPDFSHCEKSEVVASEENLQNYPFKLDLLESVYERSEGGTAIPCKLQTRYKNRNNVDLLPQFLKNFVVNQLNMSNKSKVEKDSILSIFD